MSNQAQVVVASPTPAQVQVFGPDVPSVVTVTVPGPQGPTGDKARRHDWTGTYDYLGTAPVGTAESAAAWRIVRLTINAAGAVTANQSATNATWTGRAGHTYS